MSPTSTARPAAGPTSVMTPAPTSGTRPDRAAPRFGGFSATYLRLEVRRMLRNRRTLSFHARDAAGVLPDLRYGSGLPHPERRPRQRDDVHRGQHGRVRRNAGDHERRGDGLGRAGGRVETAAAADPAAPGGLRGHQAAE